MRVSPGNQHAAARISEGHTRGVNLWKVTHTAWYLSVFVIVTGDHAPLGPHCLAAWSMPPAGGGIGNTPQLLPSPRSVTYCNPGTRSIERSQRILCCGPSHPLPPITRMRILPTGVSGASGQRSVCFG